MFGLILWASLAVLVSTMHLIITSVEVTLILLGTVSITAVRYAIVLINLVRTMRTLGWQGVLHSQSLQRALTSATSYDEYLHAAAQLAAPPAPPAPTALEAQLLCSLRASRASPEALKRVLHRAVQGNLWAVSGYAPLREELIAALGDLAKAPRREEDALFFSSLLEAGGKTALCLSGGGALALAHLGVVDTLLRHGSLPPIVHGVSGGSIVAAIACCSSNASLLRLVGAPDQLLGALPVREILRLPKGEKPLPAVPPLLFPPLATQLAHYISDAALSGEPALLSAPAFAAVIRAQIGDLTFQEAHVLSGRTLVVTVSLQRASDNGHAPSSQKMLLSFVNAPRVLIWSAVCASCALPGLLAPHPLLMVDAAGEHVPFLSPSFATLDGSLAADVPRFDLQQSFGVTRLIVSQANPHVTPLLPGGWLFPEYPAAEAGSWQEPARNKAPRVRAPSYCR